MEALNTRSDAVIVTNNITTSMSVMAANQSINENKNFELSLKLSISGVHNETTDIILNSNNLAYRAEGNANLVLSLIDRRKILRLRKISSKESHTKEYTDKPADELTELQLCSNYVKAFMQLLNKEFTIQPQITQVQIDDYDAFNSWLVPLRPAERLDKEIRCRYGMLYPDVAYIPDRLLVNKDNEQVDQRLDTFCIELKPKQGWTFFNCHSDTFPSIDLKDIDKCRYCSMQYLKAQRGVIPKPGDYCPIDLFSGHPRRMRNAIHGLIKTPQNNFRLFKNGQLIFDDKTDENIINSYIKGIFNESSAELDDFINLIISILTKEFIEVENSGGSGVDFEMNMSDMGCSDSSINYLPKKCILKQILDVQLLLKSNVCSIDEFKETNSPFLYINHNLFKKTCAEISNSWTTAENFLENLSKKERYLLAATALDCSIMLTFQCISNTYSDSLNENLKFHTVVIGRHKFLVNVTVVDVDPKSSKHFEKYVKESNNSHEAYRQHLKKSL